MATDIVHAQNESFELLVNGSVIEAAIKSYEIPFDFGGIIWLWPIVFLFLLIMVAIKVDNPAMVGVFAILGNIALGTRLAPVSHLIFALVLIFSIVIWLFSIFASRKLE
ncbi:MAG: hypothetical protein IH934_04680 [Nanoarchaeota archaeon]|nr:hypothetical protein [Nanoarchaeota archaeon]